MGLDWIKYFNIYTKNCSTSTYQMLIIDGHRSYMSIEFDDYCKFNNIIIISISAHSSHLLQPLDVGIFSSLKTVYGHQINLFIQASINHIIKLEFFIVYLAIYNKIFIKKNIKKVFKKTDILSQNPDYIILKLDICFYISASSGSHLASNYEWKLQILKLENRCFYNLF